MDAPVISTRTLVNLVIGASFGAAAALILTPPPRPPPGPPPFQLPPIAPPCPTPAPAAVQPAMAPAPAKDPRMLEKPAVNLAPVPQLPPNAAPEAVARENAELREQLRAVQQKLEMELKASAQEHGLPVAPPKDLPPRFSADQLRASFTDALKEAGFANAQVTSIDCTEYPCIVYGDGMGDREDFEKLKATNAMKGYADDSRNAMGWGRNGPDGKPGYSFGFAAYPKDGDDKDRDALRKRIAYRAKLMQESNEP